FDGDLSVYLQPITSIHLYSNLRNDNPGNVSIKYIYIFTVIGIMVLFIACINYISLSTARSATRAREVGMRKVLGALKDQIVKQFISESVFNGILAFIFGLILVYAAFPYFKNLSGSGLSMDLFKDPLLLGEMLAVLLFVCFTAGWYPAFVLSGFTPLNTLKGVFLKGKWNLTFRNLLVKIQMTISILLIILTFGFFKQIQYIKGKDLGYKSERLLSIKIFNDHSDDAGRLSWAETIKSELVSLNGVESASICSHVPGTRFYKAQFFPEQMPENQSLEMEIYKIDDDYFNTIGMGIVEGRGFSREFTSDAGDAAIINETAAKQLGWKNPVGKIIVREFGNNQKVDYHIIGVAKDFHSRSLHHKIDPLIFTKLGDFHLLTLRINSENINGTLSLIQEKWKKFEPEHPCEYFFLDDVLNVLYKTEVQMSKVIQVFTFLSLFISCLGLFSLVSFMTEKRTKEIGIRKALGATGANIAGLLTKELTYQILLANLISWPAAFYMLKYWLRNFAYKTDIGWEIFILSGITAFLITIFTISFQVLKAARSNPVDALKYE
ncbi:FtsX-like permease family protein, partial [candidate division KSB1 bacterium]